MKLRSNVWEIRRHICGTGTKFAADSSCDTDDVWLC